MFVMLGLVLALTHVGAQSQEEGTRHITNSSQSSTNDSFYSKFWIRKTNVGLFNETVTRWNKNCLKEETYISDGHNSTTREVWLQEEQKKLSLFYVDGILKLCSERNLKTSDMIQECLLKLNPDVDLNVKSTDSEYHIITQPAVLSGISTTDELLQECAEMQRKTQDEILRRKQRDQLSAGLSRRSSGRSRRGLFSQWDNLIAPGTKWCGWGDRATKYADLGGFSTVDTCCRKHDTRCRYFIPAFKTRYGITNTGFSTLMHCSCDDGFRACLKMANTAPANFIGKLFFNLVQTQCFVLKKEQVCKKWSWWGKCERYVKRERAYIRKNSRY